ncbi:MAG: hypothetical protein ABH821_03690 [archaeon]
MGGKTGPITEQGKNNSKLNAVKHGLYLHFADFFPCNLCLLRDKCNDFEQGATCKIDKQSFQQALQGEINEVQTLESLIIYHLVRLNRATQQLFNEPQHRELTRIASEIRQGIQTLHFMKQRRKPKCL